MTPGRLGGAIALTLAACIAAGLAAATREPVQQVPPGLIQNGRVETRQGGAIDREVAALAGAEPVWLLWRVPLVAGDRELCSTHYSDRGPYARGYAVDWNPPGIGSMVVPAVAPPATPVSIEAGTGLVVLVRLVDRGVERVRTLADDCPIDAGGRTLQWLSGVTPAESLRFLEGLVAGMGVGHLPLEARRNIAGAAITAISLHRDPAADTALDRLAVGTDRDARRQAAHALAGTRGARGFVSLQKMLAAERDVDERRLLVGALGLTREPGTVEALRTLTRDPDARIRAEAVYWFVQRGGAGVIAEATTLIDTDADDNVRRRAVSGLARLPADESIPALLELARTGTTPSVRKEAVGALSRSKDPRALAFMETLLKR